MTDNITSIIIECINNKLIIAYLWSEISAILQILAFGKKSCLLLKLHVLTTA